MRIALDATPAAAQWAGVGRYARELIRALVQLENRDRYVLCSSATAAESDALLRTLPPGAWRELRQLPLPARWMTVAWQRARLPLPIECLVGAFDLLHGTDFVLPPTRRPSVVTIHDLSFQLHPEFAEPSLAAYLAEAVPRALERADAVIAVSASVASEIAECYPGTAHKLVVVPNGVNVPVTTERCVTSPLVLAVGTIEPRKNHATLLGAIDIVRETHPNAKLVVAGRVGWRADEIVGALRAAEQRGAVRLVVAPDDATLDRLYRSAAVVVTAAWHEGFGLPVLEAMAHGAPVVASDIPALRETGGGAAVYADPTDAEAFAAAVCALLDNFERRATLGQRGQARARDFSWDRTARSTHRVYAQVAP
jgi:glycosyltransferase involved in cell wall biosynthesis